MPTTGKSAATTFLGCAATVGFGQSLIDAENLLFSPPRDFKDGHQSNRDNWLMTEFGPVAETVEDRTQMLTVQIYRGAAVDATAFLQGLGKRSMDSCSGTSAKGIFTGQVNGHVVSMLTRSIRCNAPGATSLQSRRSTTPCTCSAK